uniref:CRAL-TRIO domain-containing protein n=1 Tax=viral metagenome TaxID=1070528 RepID=A0A6C0HZ75_9ZZZZ
MAEKNGILYYYTCPAKATMYDVKGIMNHYDGVLSKIPKDKKWVWIVDGEGFGFTHAMQVNVAIELAQFISKCSTLKKIIIINPTFYITMIHKIVMPFLNLNIEMNELKAEDIIKIETL